jgi:hypothetical protein
MIMIVITRFQSDCRWRSQKGRKGTIEKGSVEGQGDRKRGEGGESKPWEEGGGEGMK